MSGKLKLIGVADNYTIFTNLPDVVIRRGSFCVSCGSSYGDLGICVKDICVGDISSFFLVGVKANTTDGKMPSLLVVPSLCPLVEYECVFPDAKYLHLRDVPIGGISIQEQKEPFMGAIVHMAGPLNDLLKMSIEEYQKGVLINNVQGWSYTPNEPLYEKSAEWRRREFYFINPFEVLMEPSVEITVKIAKGLPNDAPRNIFEDTQKTITV